MKREAPVNLLASRPVALTAEFAERPDVQTRWGAFLQRNRLAVGECTFRSFEHVARSGSREYREPPVGGRQPPAAAGEHPRPAAK